jgi:D-alanyl-lipoteichoic acid acyltransferase DltB (MBOAT superfamily)
VLFNSLSFLLFFPLVTGLYFVLPHRFRWPLLLVASCVFYMAFVPVYILILAFTIVVDYAAGIWIENAPPGRRRLLLLASLITNIGALAIFKYYGFLRSNVSAIGQWLPFANPLPRLDIILPIGLSFHTFQAMSYTIEVYRGHQKAERHFGIYALYVMFYPQLVAGPIERPQNLLHQFHEPHAFDYDRVVEGLKRMAFGMFKKVVVADSLAEYVNRIYGAPTHYHGLTLLVATLFFSFQIYYDFSGYSDIALGSAQVMGIKLMQNFDTPYFSTSIAEFWRRWHISLSTWFRDYLYIPLGGSRTTTLKRYRNLLIVFLVSGLWHGANWTFVIWGALHGIYLVVGDATRAERAGLAPRWASALGTFCLVCFAWIFFRAQSLADALYVATHLGTGLGDRIQGISSGALLATVLVLALTLAMESADRARGLFSVLRGRPMPIRFAFYAVLTYASLITGSMHSKQQFIYFQF